MKFIKPLLLSVAAGVSIGIGGLLNLICTANDHKILGGFLFSIGLLSICLFGFKLFTGQVGYLPAKDNKKHFLVQLLIFYLGNIIGAVGFGYLMRITAVSHNEALMETARELANHKLVTLANPEVGQQFYSLLILAFFCGFLVFLAVDIFGRESSSPFIKTIGVIICVGAFVVSGFEHCIADMFYLSFANTFFSTDWLESLLSIVLGSTGNILGALSGYYIIKLTKQN